MVLGSKQKLTRIIILTENGLIILKLKKIIILLAVD